MIPQAELIAALRGVGLAVDERADPKNHEEKLVLYWTKGEGAAKIRWGEPHDFDRCVEHLSKYFPKDPKGLCANLHKKALGVWPGREKV